MLMWHGLGVQDASDELLTSSIPPSTSSRTMSKVRIITAKNERRECSVGSPVYPST